MTPLAERSDEEVVAAYVDAGAARTAREDAFAELMGRYQRRVYAICLRTLGNRTDAEDATQDTFVNLARRADQFRGDSAWSTFVYRVAVNACRDLQRKRGRRPQTPVADVTEAQLASGTAPDTAPDEMAARETTLVVREALAQLDELSRTLLVLCAVEGHSYPEAAAMLDMPVGTIKSRVFRARARLAELLADDGADGDSPAPQARPDAPARAPDLPGGTGSRGPPA